jgi:hypothetical protein
VKLMKKIYLLPFQQKVISIRPVRDNEGTFPSHNLKRIVIGETVHSVRGCNACEIEMRLVPVVERMACCPHCGKKDWLAWLPSPMQELCIFQGEPDKNCRNAIYWYTLCIHCGRLTGAPHVSPPYSEKAAEYVYDPAEDKLLLETLKPQTKKSRRR